MAKKRPECRTTKGETESIQNTIKKKKWKKKTISEKRIEGKNMPEQQNWKTKTKQQENET
jgi:hypothetical protein